MCGTQMRVARVLKNAENMRGKRFKCWLSKMYLLTFIFLALDIGIISYLGSHGIYRSNGLSGAMLLFSNVGGYVLVAVLTFTLAVIVTVLCIKKHEKMKKKGDKRL